MKINTVTDLALSGIQVARFSRFTDHRGYFTETFRHSDVHPHIDLSVVQCNESYSKKGTIRGLHFQWNPFMGKLVRTISGHMVDVVLDIRKDSVTFGQAIMYDMPASVEENFQEWIWVPPGFAHGNFFLEDTVIEYLCSGEYSQGCEAGISPLAEDIKWTFCDQELLRKFTNLATSDDLIISDKDRDGLSVASWFNNTNSKEFTLETTNV